MFPAGRELGGKERRDFRPFCLSLSGIPRFLTLRRLPNFVEKAVPEGCFLPDSGGQRIIRNLATGRSSAVDRSAAGGEWVVRVVWKAHLSAVC